MASPATPSTLTASYAASSVLLQDLNPSLAFRRIFNYSKNFSLNLLVLHCRERKSNNWIDVSSSKVGSYRVVAAALGAETEVANAPEEELEDAAAFATPTKPKKGKAALLLKSDRACVIALLFSSYELGTRLVIFNLWVLLLLLRLRLLLKESNLTII